MAAVAGNRRNGGTQATNLRQRVVGLEWARSEELTPHPGNWRDHPSAQADALAGVLREVGVADALLAYRSARNGGALTLIDGHLRRDLTPGQRWPVVVLDVDDAEADYILATHDPLTALAQADQGALEALLSSVASGEAAVQALLSELYAGVAATALTDTAGGAGENLARGLSTPSLIRLVVDVGDVGMVERAIMATGETNRGTAIRAICQAYLDAKG
jgi:hypothetical protein